MYADNVNMICRVCMAKGEIAPGKLRQAFQFGAQQIQMKINIDDALPASLKKAKDTGGYTVNSVNPFRLEGQKTIVYRVLEHLNWNPPDWIVYPGGALGNTSSCGKCFIELYEWGWIKKIPRMAIVNAEGANAFYELYNGMFESKRLTWNGGRPDLALVDRYYTYLDKKGIRPKPHPTAIQIEKHPKTPKALAPLDLQNGIAGQENEKEWSNGRHKAGQTGLDGKWA